MCQIKGTVSAVKRITGKINNTINDYDLLKNKPKINSIELSGDMTLEDFGLKKISNKEIEEILEVKNGV